MFEIKEQTDMDDVLMVTEDLFDLFDKQEMKYIRKFIKRFYKIFNEVLSLNETPDRYILNVIKMINQKYSIQCTIRNCEDLHNFSKTDMDITFKVFNRDSKKLIFIVAGDGSLKGCNKENIDDFVKIVDVAYKQRFGPFRIH